MFFFFFPKFLFFFTGFPFQLSFEWFVFFFFFRVFFSSGSHPKGSRGCFVFNFLLVELFFLKPIFLVFFLVFFS